MGEPSDKLCDPQHVHPTGYGATNNICGEPPIAGTVQQKVTVTVAFGTLTSHKSVCEAYILCIPFGILGLHHFYLGRYVFGFLYFFTLGLGGVGWIVDIFRMPQLVRDANKRINYPGKFESLTITDAYVLWFPLGFIGFHHYYLHRPAWGIAYTFTGGLFGIGWLCDLFRIPSLVREANDRLQRERVETTRTPRKARLCDAYALGLSPAGIFGAHHFYLGNYFFGIFYLFTLGLGGLGWVCDWFRMTWLVDRANHPEKQLLGKRHKYIDDAYIMAVPFGLLGAHHFYLERPIWGRLYSLTFGLAGIGWLVDLVRMPCLVRETNARLEKELRIVVEIQEQLEAQHCTVTQIQASDPSSYNNSPVAPPAPNESSCIQPPPNIPNYDCSGVKPA